MDVTIRMNNLFMDLIQIFKVISNAPVYLYDKSLVFKVGIRKFAEVKYK